MAPDRGLRLDLREAPHEVRDDQMSQDALIAEQGLGRGLIRADRIGAIGMMIDAELRRGQPRVAPVA